MNNNSFYCVMKNAGIDECVRLRVLRAYENLSQAAIRAFKNDFEKNNNKETTVLRSYLQSERK